MQIEEERWRETSRIRLALSHSRALDHEFHLSGRNIFRFLNNASEQGGGGEGNRRLPARYVVVLSSRHFVLFVLG